MKKPEGFIQKRQENKVCLLKNPYMELSSLSSSGTNASTLL